MSKVSSSTNVQKKQETQQTKKSEAKTAKEATQPKSADINSTNPSERAKDINRNNEIQDGKFKSRSDATVGDIAQANAMKEDGTVDPAEVKQQVQDLVTDNPQLAQAAKDAGINLENPTDEDIQKLANLDVKAGQEVNVPAKAEQAIAPEEAKPEEAKAEEAKAEEAGAEEAKAPEEGAGAEKPQEAQAAGAEKNADSPIAEVIELINKAEQATDPNQKRQLADSALQKINALKQQYGVADQQAQQPQQAQNPNQAGQAQNAQSSQVVNAIQTGGQLDKAQLDKVLQSGDKGQISAMLNSLEARANAAKNGNSNTLNALNLLGQNNWNNQMLGAMKPLGVEIPNKLLAA